MADIIMCKNCVNMKHKRNMIWCKKLFQYVSDNFYCAYAIEREEPPHYTPEYRRQYNAHYYQTVTKPKREREKQERINGTGKTL